MGGRDRTRGLIRGAWRFRLRVAALAAVLILAFSLGFYLAGLYAEISELIEQRAAALTSAIYSAPATLRPDTGLAQSHLEERLAELDYTRVATVSHPGEYSQTPAAITLFVRDFKVGVHEYPSQTVRLETAKGRVAGITDASGKELDEVWLEPQVIGRLMPDAPAERVEVRLDELPAYVTGGLLATEDRYFYYHFGFDPVRIIEAALIDLRRGHLDQGASTLTQQLARTFIPPHRRSFTRKFREAAIAIVLEMRLGKQQILERYVNDVALGDYHGAPIYGLPAAARDFFHKDLRELTPAEAAVLIGMIRAPSDYDPRRHPERCLRRRDTVLALMRQADLIDDSALRFATESPLAIAKDSGSRPAPYFTDYVTAQVLKTPGLSGHLAGVKVYTTLDPLRQSVAEESIVANLERLERDHKRLRSAAAGEPLQSSLVALDPETGAILAMVGGRNYGVSQFNRAAAAQRQPGSAFKPIVYLTALDPDRSPLEEPLTLASILPDRPISYDGWTPANYEGTYQGQANVAQALAESLNAPTAYVGSLLGPERIVRTAHEFGINGDLAAVLPIAIGADEVTLLDLVSAYEVFATGGVARPSYAIESVVDGQGHEIFHHEAVEKRIVRPDVAYLITAALQGVLRSGTGAGARAMGLNFPAAGKTGTTDDFHDAYFIGYTPDVVCGVWVGFDDPKSLNLPGAQAALPAWVKFMVKADAGPHDDFEVPEGIIFATIDPESGLLANSACPRKMRLPFIGGTQPIQVCSLHGGGLLSSAAPIAPPSSSSLAPPGVPAPGPSSGSPGGLFGAIGSFFGHLLGH